MTFAGATDREIDQLIAYEHSYSFVREIRPNDSPEIRIFQKFTGNAPPDSWCCSFQCYCLFHVWENFPLKRTASCQQLRVAAAMAKWLMPRGETPRKGDLGLIIDVGTPATPRDHAHHIFLVKEDMHRDRTFPTFEGNTNPKGGSDGYGCFDRDTRVMGGKLVYEFIRMPRALAIATPAVAAGTIPHPQALEPPRTHDDLHVPSIWDRAYSALTGHRWFS